MEYVRLSKQLAWMLRHGPHEVGLTLDPKGWVSVEALLDVLRSRHHQRRRLTEMDLQGLIESAEKKRFEIRDGRIRALYGHSLDERIEKTPAEPPEYLYHGTTASAAALIRTDGLKPMQRQYVHLSLDKGTAIEVGKRRAASPVVLLVRARDAFGEGNLFYKGHEGIWLADPIPPGFIEGP